jgi:predicted ATPase/class 3 adenylate cyclase
MELPSGTVTILFTDVEGSTRRLLKSQQDYVEALQLQRELLRDAWSTNGGAELGTEGDSFMVAFGIAEAAVAAAVAAQRALHAANWPGKEPLRVRMGIHTGTPMRHADGYVGLDVHLAARVASAANGGQVLVSEATAALTRDAADCTFRDLGHHRLRDIPRPAHLFQVRAGGFPDVRAAIRSVGSTSNLPTTETPLLGRKQELDDIAGFVRRQHGRLVTLTGPGGTGKTRLAIAASRAAATEHGSSVYFVPLEGITTAHEMWAPLATSFDVPDEKRAPALLLDHLAHLDALVVLDNLEQVEGAAGAVAQLLAATHNLRVIATSRHPLHVAGEQEYPVPPLAVPTSDKDGEGPAMELLVATTRRFRPSFTITATNRTALVEICGRLDGLPLALEIAAARLRILSPQQLLQKLESMLDLTGVGQDRPERHHTLRRALTWSYQLLTPEAQRLLRCLSVFGGSADLSGAEWMASRVDATGSLTVTEPLAVLEQLVDSSLLRLENGPAGQPRIAMLNTVQAFAAQQLALSPDEDVARWAAVAFYDDLSGRLMRDRDFGWRIKLADGLEVEQNGYRLSLEWLLQSLNGHTLPLQSKHSDAGPARVGIALEMTFRLHFGLLAQRSRFEESSRLLEQALTAAHGRTGLRMAACLAATAFLALVHDDLAKAGERLAAAAEAVGDTRTDADLDPIEAEFMRFLVDNVRGLFLRDNGQFSEARELAQALIRRTTDPTWRPVAIHSLGLVAYGEGRFEESIRLHNEAAALATSVGDEALAASIRHNNACVLRLMGRPDDAEQEFRRIWKAVLAYGDPALAIILAEDYGAVLIELGRFHDAGPLIGSAEAERERVNLPRDREQVSELREPLASAQRALGPQWAGLLDAGRGRELEDLLRTTFAAPATHRT